MTRNNILTAIIIAGLGISGCGNGTTEYTIEQKTDAILKQIANEAPGKPVPPEAKKQISDKLKEQEAIANAARKEGLDKDENLKIISAITAEQALASSYLQKKAAAYKPTDADLKKIYDNEINNSKSYHLRHILVKTEAEANDIIAKIKSGEKFDVLAKEKSIDVGSGEKGGDLGWSPLNAFVPEFKNAALALKPKEMSQTPIKTQFGYHVLELVEAPKAPTNIPPFEQAKEQVKEMAKKQYIQELQKTLMAK
jgi:peptidyl-prolyl cis-trans isomerase C